MFKTFWTIVFVASMIIIITGWFILPVLCYLGVFNDIVSIVWGVLFTLWICATMMISDILRREKL